MIIISAEGVDDGIARFTSLMIVFPPETEKGMVIFLQNGRFQRAAFHEEGKVILKRAAFHKEGKGILKHLQYTVKFHY